MQSNRKALDDLLLGEEQLKCSFPPPVHTDNRSRAEYTL
jgi:hypothetical protein